MEIQQIDESIGQKLVNLLKINADNQYVQCPCKVLAVNGNYVDVLPIINDDEENQPIYDVKIKIQETQRAYIFLGVKKGDRGVLRFFDRSIENYSINGSEEYNNDDRMHNDNDGCFELGFVPDNEAFKYAVENKNLTVDEILSNFNSDDFNTILTEEEEEEYQIWFANMQSQGYIVDGDTGYDYDYRGAFKSGFSPSEVSGHWLDTWKKPNHETFSNESIYASGEYEKYAGSWDGDNYKMPESRIMPDPEIELGLKNGFCRISIQSDGTLNISSNVSINITGNVSIKGDLTVSGEVIGGTTGIELTKHYHTDSQGGSTTAPTGNAT